jgi:hypothetical protein
LPSHQLEARVAKDTNQHICSAQMSLTEIVEELPKLTPEERRTIYQQIDRVKRPSSRWETLCRARSPRSPSFLAALS